MQRDEWEIWAALELPEPAAAPPGFAGRVLARARAERGRDGAPLASGWSRLAAAGVVAAGIAGGIVLARWSESSSATETPFAWADSTLAEQYLAGAGGAGDAGASQ
jgi:hypothetical protein